jgi:hypothetical protein
MYFVLFTLEGYLIIPVQNSLLPEPLHTFFKYYIVKCIENNSLWKRRHVSGINELVQIRVPSFCSRALKHTINLLTNTGNATVSTKPKHPYT